MSSVLLEDLDADTYAAYLRQTAPTVIIPTGATEQHGPHMPIGVDAMLSSDIAARKYSSLVTGLMFSNIFFLSFLIMKLEFYGYSNYKIIKSIVHWNHTLS